jgi:hypothetical protein
MAIDTQNKRRSVSGYTGSPIAPVADGSITAADRQAVAWLYSGIGQTLANTTSLVFASFQVIQALAAGSFSSTTALSAASFSVTSALSMTGVSVVEE